MVNINIDKCYDYYDENGIFLFQVVRLYPKKFFQRKKENNNWIYNLNGVKRVLYKLSDVIKAKAVFIVEGEKDAETLIDRGFIATTCPCGSSSWKREYNNYLKGKDVYIIPDNDDVGLKFAKTIACNIFSYVKSVKIIRLLDLNDGEDITDWFNKGHTKEELIDMVSFQVKNLTRKDIECFIPHKVKKIINNKNILSMNDIEKALQYPIENLIEVNKNGKALCINHTENNPSMDTRNGFCFCYSCGWHGNVIDLAQRLWKCDFKTAVEKILDNINK